MTKIKEYYQVGNREELTVESLLVLMEDMYKDLALAINSGSSSPDTGDMIGWCIFKGTNSSPIPITNGYNIASITKNGTGTYTLNFTTPVEHTNYGILVTCNAITGLAFHSGGVKSKSLNSCVIQTFYFNVSTRNNEAVDAIDVNVYIFDNNE